MTAGGWWSVGIDEGRGGKLGGGGVGEQLVEIGVQSVAGVGLVFDVADEPPGSICALAEVGEQPDAAFLVEEQLLLAGVVGEFEGRGGESFAEYGPDDLFE